MPFQWVTFSPPSVVGLPVGAIPGGWLLDKFGSKKVYTYQSVLLVAVHLSAGILSICSRWPWKRVFQCSSCVSCWASRKHRRCKRSARIDKPPYSSRRKSAVRHLRFLTLHICSPWRLFSPLLRLMTFAWGWEHVFTVMDVIGFVCRPG